MGFHNQPTGGGFGGGAGGGVDGVCVQSVRRLTLRRRAGGESWEDSALLGGCVELEFEVNDIKDSRQKT